MAVMKYFGPKNALAKYICKVLKNCNNEIRSNEIRIRRGPPVLLLTRSLVGKKAGFTVCRGFLPNATFGPVEKSH